MKNDFIKNKIQVTKKDKKKRKASIILLVLMVVWTIGSIFGVVGCLRTFTTNTVSALTVEDIDISSAEVGGHIPIATYSDYVISSENKFYAVSSSATNANNLVANFNGLRGVITANVTNAGSWTGYRLDVPLKALYGANKESPFNKFIFHAYYNNYQVGASGFVRAVIRNNLFSSAIQTWDSNLIYVTEDWIGSRNLNINIDLTSYNDDSMFLSFYFYFVGYDTEYTGDIDIEFTDIGLYSNYDIDSPLTSSTVPSWSVNYGYIYNDGYNFGYDTRKNFENEGVFRDLEVSYTADNFFFRESDLTFPPELNQRYTQYLNVTYFDGGVNISRPNLNFIYNWELVATPYWSFNQSFIFSQPFTFKNVAFKFVANPRPSGYYTVYLTLKLSSGSSLLVGVQCPQIYVDGQGTDTYILGESEYFNAISQLTNYDTTNAVVTQLQVIADNVSVAPITQIVNTNSSYMLGYDNGFNTGVNSVDTNRIYSEGYQDGKQVGIDIGYNQGLVDSNDYTFIGLLSAVVDAPIRVFSSFLNFDLLGFNMSNFFFSILTLCLIITLVRLIMGGK